MGSSLSWQICQIPLMMHGQVKITPELEHQRIVPVTLPDLAIAEASTTTALVDGLNLENQPEEQNDPKVALVSKNPDSIEDSVSWL